ncbi:MAG: hypothetical protein J07HB67_00724 [halophilic archaeon J07HB67]|nr:MAG: hypothetical protein J07HB67_00724 [halophilic archaeon J07HB67]
MAGVAPKYPYPWCRSDFTSVVYPVRYKFSLLSSVAELADGSRERVVARDPVGQRRQAGE